MGNGFGLQDVGFTPDNTGITPGDLGTYCWLRLGNSGTNPAIDFLGTTDAVGFNIRTNNTIRQFFQSSGEIGLHTGNTAYTSAFTVGNNSALNDIQRWYSSGTALKATLTDAGKFGLNVTPTALLHLKSLTSNPANYVIRIEAQSGAIPYAFAISDESEVTVNSQAANNIIVGTPDNIFQTYQGGNYFQHWNSILSFGDNTTKQIVAVNGGTFGVAGMYSNHAFRIRTNNLERITIQATGETVLGVTTSYASQLTVYNVNALNNIQRWYSSTGTIAMVLREDTRVIIGNAPLNVNNPSLQISGGSMVWQESAAGYALTDAVYGHWQLYSAGSGGGASFNIYQGGSGMHSIFNANGLAVSRAGTGVSVPLTALDIQGSLSWAYKATAVNYPVAQDDTTIFADVDGITITLPSAVLYPRRVIVIKNRVATPSAITVASTAGTIDGNVTWTITNSVAGIYNANTFQSDGTNWYIIA